MAKPKLALIPAAQGGELFSVLPSSGVGDFDFSRSGSATRINSQGLIEEVDDGVSRLNYPMIDGKVVGCPHHILEPSRTNKITYSEDFSNWFTNGSATTSINTLISPNGALNADTLNAAISNYSGFNKRFTTIIGSSYTNSVFFKKGTQEWVGLVKSNGSAMAAWFNLGNGTIGTVQSGVDAKIEDFGNGWYRCSITMDATITNSYIQIAVVDYDNSTSNSLVGGNIYAWGAQVEEGSYATSYIPTNGSVVTRSAETANGSGDAATFSDSEGVLMAEISALADDLNIEAISINANNADNRLALFKWNVSNRLQIRVNINGATLIDAGVSVSNIEDLNKISLKYKSGDYALWINGFEVYVNSLADTPIGLSNLSFDSNGSNGVPFKGKTKQLQYYNSALTDSELEQLTSWTSFTDMAQGLILSDKTIL
jgi:hypothetical protein